MLEEKTQQKPPLPNEIPVPDRLVDRTVGLLVWLQKEDPAVLLFNLEKIRELAGQLQSEYHAIRGPYVICHLCTPAVRVKMEEIGEHDIKVHKVCQANVYAGGSHAPHR